MYRKMRTISIFGLLLILFAGTGISCAQTAKTTKLNPPKHVELTVKNFSEELDLKENDLGGWRLVNSENRTVIIATEGDRISWTAGNDQSLQLQFPEKMAKRLFKVIEGDRSIFNDKFTFNLEKGETLTVEVKHPHPEGTQDLFELTYAVLNRTAGELVATDSPPKIILMFTSK